MTHYTDSTGNTTHLTGDDAMAFGFLRNAADAILARSSLSAQLDALNSTCHSLHESVDQLTATKDGQAERIADLERQLAELSAINMAQRTDLAEAHDTVRARQSDIDLLDATVASLTDHLARTTRSRDYHRARGDMAIYALRQSVDKVNAMHSVLGKPPVEPDPVDEIISTAGPDPYDEPAPAEPQRMEDHAPGYEATPPHDSRPPQPEPDFVPEPAYATPAPFDPSDLHGTGYSDSSYGEPISTC